MKKLYFTHEEVLAGARASKAKYRDARNAARRASWDEEAKAKYRAYEKTPKGYLMRKYRNMQSRITGVQSAKYHLYRGKSLLDRPTFYDWAMANEEFHRLFAEYQQSGYEMKLAPSVNRIDSDLGYEIDNMEWITHSENSRLGSINRHGGNL